MKFGKQLQKRQLDIPEYAASFVNYKALKKLIKKLSATPTLHAQHASVNEAAAAAAAVDPQMALQANKATFFFRLERELDKVNAFYLQKEAELKLRLKALLDKKKLLQCHDRTISKLSTTFVTLEEGFQQFGVELNKLQQFVEINATAFSKILKKWDKVSKSRTKELYLSRAVEVQPCFNREIISELSDVATTSLLELGAWAEGEKVQLQVQEEAAGADYVFVGQPPVTDEAETASQLLQAANAGNIGLLLDWITRLKALPNATSQMNRVFLAAIAEAPDEALNAMLGSGLVDVQAEDDITERNCLHEAAVFGRLPALQAGLSGRVDVTRVDVYGRIALHYACMHGRIDMLQALVDAAPSTVDFVDHDRFTPLIHAIVHNQLECVRKLLSYKARINPCSDSDHVPLNLASQHGSVEAVRLLLANGAQIVCDAEGLYAQHHVARSGRVPQLLLLLRDFGADMNEADKLNQWTPLFHAASEGHVRCLRVLLEHGARADFLDEKGLSAVYYAAWEGHLECMRLLASAGALPGVTGSQQLHTPSPLPLAPFDGAVDGAASATTDADGIPDLSLPPPFIPLRRYGHNFLDSKTFIQITFEGDHSDPVVFYNGGRYPAARLTISSKSSDLIPRNILLPIQEDTRSISFHIDNPAVFSIDFDIFPTFGAKVIAKTTALSNVFNDKQGSAGHCCLPLFDQRLRAIGQISFGFQVIKPFQGTALEITDFATYWKATTQPDSSSSTASITESSLSGEHVRLFVQLTSDLVPVLHPHWLIPYGGVALPVAQLTYEQFVAVGAERKDEQKISAGQLCALHAEDVLQVSRLLAGSFLSLKDALRRLSPAIKVDLHVLHPSAADERRDRLRCPANLNEFADAVLSDVFDHSRELRQTSPDFMRSIIFSSYSPDLCTALNWKQPNYPVFLCNDLGRDERPVSRVVRGSGSSSISIKEAVKIAQNNNFMGLICCFRLLDMVPALVESIRDAGLVLVSDSSEEGEEDENQKNDKTAIAAAPPPSSNVRVDGILNANGVLRFGPVMP